MSTTGTLVSHDRLNTGTVPLPRFAVAHFRAAAILNIATCTPNFLFPSLMANILGVEPLNYPYVAQAFAGLGIVFGFIYYEISRNPLRNRILIKWGWIAKSVSFAVVLNGYFAGVVFPEVLLFFVIEDLIWIPSFVYYDRRIRSLARDTGLHKTRA